MDFVNSGMQYQIVVDGIIEAHWQRWFEGMSITITAESTTVLRGTLTDQAALFGLINRIRDLGFGLIELRRITPPAAGGHSSQYVWWM